MKRNRRNGEAAKGRALFIALLIALSPIRPFAVSSAFCQAPRPPVDKLSKMRDVAITSLFDKQPLRYDIGSSKWINSFSVGPLVIYDGTGTSSADFGNRVLANTAGTTAIDWSNVAGPKFPLGLMDSSNVKSVDVAGRKLYGTDGTTVKIQFDGTGVRLPQLADGWLKVGSGNGTVSSTTTLPNAGTIPATYDVLVGDGAGNALASGFLSQTPNTFSYISSLNALMGMNVQNPTEGTLSAADYTLGAGSTASASIKLFAVTYTPFGLITGGDLQLAVPNGTIVLQSHGRIKLSNNDGTNERVGIGNGLMVGTTTDPGAGVVNVSSGFRIGNAAAAGTLLQGNATSYVASTMTWPSGAAPAAGTGIQSDGTNVVFSADVQRDTQLVAYRALGSVLLAIPVAGGVENITAAFTLLSGQIQFIPVYLPVAATVTGVKFYQAAQGNYTADTSNVVALYSYSGGTLTQRAISADDGNLWKAAANTWSSKAFSATYSAAPGLYYVACLYHNSAQTSAPKIGACAPLNNAAVTTVDLTNSAKLYGNLTGQTTCPASQAMSGITSDAAAPWVALY